VATAKISDLVVVLPGITGSALAKDGHEVWGLSGSALLRGIRTLGESVSRLTLPTGIGHGDPEDGVEATRLIPGLHKLPGIGGIDGYASLVGFLRQLLPDQRQLIEFAYDWRLSNRLNAHRLEQRVRPALKSWRRDSVQENAKLVLVCHSMGGLIARDFLASGNGAEITRRLITLGTPFRGSPKAAATLVRGVEFRRGPLSVKLSFLDEFVRSLPSLYQLLPTYPCLAHAGNAPTKLRDVSTALDHKSVVEAASYHDEMAAAIQQGGDPAYEVQSIVGLRQPTAQTIAMSEKGVELLNEHEGHDYAGDGTVPRFSASWPEWERDDRAVFASQRHASLQDTDLIRDQLQGVLTAVPLGQFKGTGVELSVDLPEAIVEGETLTVDVFAQRTGSDAEEPHERLALQATVTDGDGQSSDSFLLDNHGAGRYTAIIDGLPANAYYLKVETVPGVSDQVDAVADSVLVWPVSDDLA
jgi:pimeloyl-ACP methyl ester carboxylesterase